MQWDVSDSRSSGFPTMEAHPRQRFLGIVEKVNELLGTDSREKINYGEVVKAIILNPASRYLQSRYQD